MQGATLTILLARQVAPTFEALGAVFSRTDSQQLAVGTHIKVSAGIETELLLVEQGLVLPAPVGRGESGITASEVRVRKVAVDCLAVA